jgi:polysaccharide biosynthesis protein PslA
MYNVRDGVKIDTITSGTAVGGLDAVRPAVSRQRARIAAYLLLALVDTAAILGGFALAAMIRGATWLEPGGVDLGLATLVTYFLIAANRGAFSFEALESMSESVRRALSSFILAALLITLFSFFTQSGLLISRLAFATALVISGVGIGIGRVLGDRAYIARLEGKLTDVLLIIDGGVAPANVKHCTVVDAEQVGLVADLNQPVMLDRIATTVRPFDRVIISCPRDRQTAWAVVLKGTHVIGEILLREENRLGAIGVGEFGSHDTILVSRGPLSLANRLKKRTFDVVVSLAALIALAPLLIIVAIVIRLESRGPALFRQPRVGQSNATFEILKFRSMRMEGSDVAGDRSTGRDDDRVTRVGRFIRATSIDELPQLINVLRGDMSIVGPRPHALGSMAGDQLFWEVSERYWMRHALKPGITGLAQIRGFRGTTHRREDLEQRLQADLEYLNGWRLGRDIAIVIGTLRVLVHPNAY